MAVQTRQSNSNAIFFVTFTCYKWLTLLEKTNAYDAIYKWFHYLKERDTRILGFVLMPNHVHLMLYLPPSSPELYKVIGNGKRFLAYEIVKRLRQLGDFETLKILQNGVSEKEGNKGKLHQVFILSYDAKLCEQEDFILQKIRYMHNNPVSGKWSIVDDFVKYPHSSA